MLRRRSIGIIDSRMSIRRVPVKMHNTMTTTMTVTVTMTMNIALVSKDGAGQGLFWKD